MLRLRNPQAVLQVGAGIQASHHILHALPAGQLAETKGQKMVVGREGAGRMWHWEGVDTAGELRGKNTCCDLRENR